MRIPDSALSKANTLLKGDVQSNMQNLKTEASKSPKAVPLLERWGRIVPYMTSSKVPLRKRALVLGGILWMLFPDPFLGPLDDILIGVALLPWLNGELEKFDSGGYGVGEAPPSRDGRVGSPEPAESQLHRPFNTGASNPFYIQPEELGR